MPWCPKCKSEYEKGVVFCKQCQIDLVENLEDYVEYKPLVRIDPATAEGLIEYLNYSGILDYKIEEEEEALNISVNKKDFEQAAKHLSVYVYNLKKAAEENEDTYEDAEKMKEYDTSTVLDTDKISDLRTSGITYYILGGIILVFTYLNMRNTINIINPILEGVFLFAGIALFGLGHVTMKKIPQIEETVTKVQDQLEEMINWYENAFSLDSFYETKEIDVNQYDEGALYFVALDTIKADLQKQFPEADLTLINSAAEDIYYKI